jgi:rfaE bifunctional protein nucleotidyltransferase chain/domain
MGRFYTRPELVRTRREWKAAGKKVVFTNGCYDILHPGHIRLLERARALGDVLILALNTDSSVQRLKGPSRPILNERQRADVAVSLEAVDAVTLFDEDTPRELIADVLPDVLIKGADWAHFIARKWKQREALSWPCLSSQGFPPPTSLMRSSAATLDESSHTRSFARTRPHAGVHGIAAGHSRSFRSGCSERVDANGQSTVQRAPVAGHRTPHAVAHRFQQAGGIARRNH